MLNDMLKHCWEVKTKFDRKSQPVELTVTFKVGVTTGDAMQKDVANLFADFLANVKEQPK